MDVDLALGVHAALWRVRAEAVGLSLGAAAEAIASAADCLLTETALRLPDQRERQAVLALRRGGAGRSGAGSGRAVAGGFR